MSKEYKESLKVFVTRDKQAHNELSIVTQPTLCVHRIVLF